MSGTVYGVGVYNLGKYAVNFNGIITKEYRTWRGMLERCYDLKCQQKNPTYKGCTVSENFKNFQYFAEWCNGQIGFGNMGWQLDKDVLAKGNKIYSEQTCSFLPREINTLFTSRAKLRGSCPIGVSFHESARKYQANFRENGQLRYLGLHQTQEEAFSVYKEAKENYVKQVALRYKDLIREDVYLALFKLDGRYR